MTDNNSVITRLGASLKKIMAGERPTFMVHRSYNWSGRLGEVFSGLGILHGTNLGLGAIVRMTNTSPDKAAAFMSKHSAVPLRLVDPELYNVPGTAFGDADPKSSADKWPILKSLPSKPSTAWVKSVLRAQRNAGASVLLSASGWVHDVDPARALQRQMEFVDESRQSAGDEPMMVNLTLDCRWLTEATLRDTLFEEIVEQAEQHWYLRFYWPQISTRYGQLLDSAVLEGYRELAALCGDEGKRLFLPNTGLTGWVATALGASGFSTGQSWPEQAFARQPFIASRKGAQRPPAIPRFFEPTVLHTTELIEHERLLGFSGHISEVDQFALEIETDGHTPEVSSLHYLMSVGELQAQLRHRNPRQVARKEVRRAGRFIDDLGRADKPAGANRPQHLPAWTRLLA